jgi:hypothetical protein
VEVNHVSGVKKSHPRIMILQERYPRAKQVEYTTYNFIVSILLFLKKSITTIREEAN